MPGTALATGFARYEIPVDNLLASTIKMDFVPLEITGGGDVLRGKGRLIYSNGNLQFDDLILRGKGEWRINGHYAKDKVDLGMSFKDTVFTPILDLIPQIKDYDPRATGSLNLQLSGAYGKPDAKVSLKDLTGSISGIKLTAKELLGSLEKGALQVQGVLVSDDSLGATLDTTAKAKLISYTPIQLEDLEALGSGSLNISPIGLIQNIKARVYGDSGGFKLDVTGEKGGNISIKGDISPQIKLKLEGKALVMPIPDYFVADSLLDATLTFEGDGGRFYDVDGQLNIARLQTQLQQNSSNASSTASSTAKPSTPSNTKPNPFLQQVRFRGIEITAAQGLRVSESFATLEAGGKLVVTGTMANPELNGALEAVGGSGGRGTVRLGINTYNIQTAVAAFSPIEGIYPSIEIKSRGEVKASCTTLASPATTTILPIPIDLNIQVRWLPDNKNPNLRRIDVQPTVSGNCPDNGYRRLETAELYSLVTLGSSNANLGGLAQQSLDTVLSVFILGDVLRQIETATGIDIDLRSNVVEVLAQRIADPTTEALLNFTVNFGIDLSRALRLNIELNNNRIYTDPDNKNRSQLLGGAVNLNWQSDDGRFGIRFGTPFFLPNSQQQFNSVFDVIQPEAQFTFNLSNTFGFAFTTSIPASNNFKFTFGFSLRF
jgi:predicted XRE-type DNA-binding protein